jgi:hypothetical protein
MFAIAALIVFIVGLALELWGVGNNWVAAFLGLACLAAHAVFAWTPWNRNP